MEFATIVESAGSFTLFCSFFLEVPQMILPTVAVFCEVGGLRRLRQN
jgi:hypothetical protein